MTREEAKQLREKMERNKETIIDLYQNGKKGSRGIGRIYGVNEYHILKMLREWNIPIRDSYKKKIDNKEKK